jgi:hypothetical protein
MASAKQGSGKAGKKAAGKSKVAKTADKGNANRRRFDRRETHIAAQIDYDGKQVNGTVTNLSLEGCLFAPRLNIPVGDRIRLKLAGESKAVPATVKAVSDLGVHCLLHAGGATLGRLSVAVDDMALLMLNAGRPHAVLPRALPDAGLKKAGAGKKTAAKKAATAKPAALKKKAVKKKAAKKPAAKARKR